jgi:hypothetical protein
MKWFSRAAGFTAVAAFVLAVVRSTYCVANWELVLLSGLSGVSLAVWLDEPARGRGKRVFSYLAIAGVVTSGVLGTTLELNDTACG